MKETCLFCNKDDGLRHSAYVNYVCSNCVQKLLHTDKNQMKKLKTKAEQKDNKRILMALRFFYR